MMSIEMLFSTIQHKNIVFIQESLKLIQLHRRTLNLYLRELERADKEGDVKRYFNIKDNKIPLVEESLKTAKQNLLKTIAMNAFEVIDGL